ncbi:hypothetical protein FNV43_RR21263 [Rhamnella rubrinervis]|uniref:Uncharacterized protein n=1 Tax=Rhamnella rubrinervis TaxID=2594499 RepID=A0A8K0DXK0_9ROSA|nr:hypothetical protein FNV43_RR21263 [Rhamnella rubrinervis]
MMRTLPRSNRTFNPYRPISNDVARQYAQFMNSDDKDAIVEYNTISVKKIFYRELEFSLTWLIDDVSINNFHKALHNVVSRMRDPELPVRVDSIFALRSFVVARRDLNEIRPILPQLLDGYGIHLETIMDKFGEEMALYALCFCQNLCHLKVDTTKIVKWNYRLYERDLASLGETFSREQNEYLARSREFSLLLTSTKKT